MAACGSLPPVKSSAERSRNAARVRRIFLRLRGARGVSEEELFDVY